MKQHLKTLVGLAIAAFFLWWSTKDVKSWAEVGNAVRHADWGYFALACVATTAGLWVRAWRWKVLLRPVAPDVAFQPRLAAVSVGFAANNLLPGRVGEFMRVWSLSRLAGIPIPSVLASLVVERVFDGLTCVGLLLLAMASPSFPHLTAGKVDPIAAARIVSAIAGTLAVVLFALALAPAWTVGVIDRVAAAVLPERVRRPLVDALHAFVGGLGILRDPKLLLLSTVWAVGQWVFLSLSYLWAFRAFHITEVPFMGAIFMQALVSMAVAIPAAPGFFGTFEAASKFALGLWGVDATRTVAYALGFHVGGFVTVTAVGLYYMRKLDLKPGDARRTEEEVEQAVEADPRSFPPAGAAAEPGGA
ncbi:MAG: putative rane protein [Gemmatimonadetes bacterium]|nr:putative rane protein [Gemmatimonadota bacterium]